MEEKLPQESAMEELKGILETVKKSPSRGSQESVPSPPGKSPVSSELEVILRRRRKQACDSGDGDESRDGQISKVSSSDSLNGRHSQSSHSSDSSGKEPEGPTGPGPGQSPREPASPSGRGPGPAVAARRRSDSGQEPQAGSWQDRRSRTSLSEKEAYSEAPVTNGCIVSGEEPENQKPEKWAPQGNGISHLNPGLTVESDTHATLSPSLSAVPNPLSGNGSTDAEC
nr:proline-rich proteoglycan 2 [Salvelinus alpinus]